MTNCTHPISVYIPYCPDYVHSVNKYHVCSASEWNNGSGLWKRVQKLTIHQSLGFQGLLNGNPVYAITLETDMGFSISEVLGSEKSSHGF